MDGEKGGGDCGGGGGGAVKGREGELWSVCKMKKELNEKERLFHFIKLTIYLSVEWEMINMKIVRFLVTVV